ncbi:MAG TPA: hypothetical protein VMS22_11855 [Candidatus Eisenbacteria bacterium]|nr:hypothetical protein [Candidatus Eisenbacteria bacterium]
MLTLCVSLPVNAVELVPGDILVLGNSQQVGPGIILVDPVTHAQTLMASGTFGDFTVAPGGSLYATVGDSVVRIDPDTGAQTTVSSGGLLAPMHPFDASTPGGSYVAASGDTLFVARQYDERVIQIDPRTGAQSILSSGGLLLPDSRNPSLRAVNGTRDLAIGPNDELLVLQNEYIAIGEVIGIALATGVQSYAFLEPHPESSLFADPDGFGVSADGTLVACDRGVSGFFFQLDPVLGAVMLPVPMVDRSGNVLPMQAVNAAISGDGTLLLIRAAVDLVRFDPYTGGLDFLASGDFDEVEVVPAPEPRTALLVLCGLCAFSIATARRRTAQSHRSH